MPRSSLVAACPYIHVPTMSSSVIKRQCYAEDAKDLFNNCCSVPPDAKYNRSVLPHTQRLVITKFPRATTTMRIQALLQPGFEHMKKKKKKKHCCWSHHWRATNLIPPSGLTDRNAKNYYDRIGAAVILPWATMLEGIPLTTITRCTPSRVTRRTWRQTKLLLLLAIS